MRPAAVLIAIIFGSSAAISFGLIGTSVIFVILKDEHREFARELKPLLVSSIWFVVLSAAAGAALYSTLKALRWKVYAQGAMVLALVAVATVYWPRQ